MAKEYLSADPPYVVVVKGDTLSEIAEKYGKMDKIPSTNQTTYGKGGWLEKLVDINDITNANRIVVGQKIILSTEGKPVVKKTNNTSKPIIKAFGLQSNTDRTLYVTWTWTKSNTDNYRIIWYYDTGDGVWFIGTDTTTTDKQYVYSGAPQNAKRVKCKILPVSKTKTVNGKETKYWTASWSDQKTYSFSSNPPVTPSNLAASLDEATKTKLTATLSNIDTSIDGINATQVQFRIYRVVNNVNKQYKTSGVVKVVNKGAAYTCNVATGYAYKVECRSVKNGLYSDWSDMVEAGESAPAAPAAIKECRATEVTTDAEGKDTVPGVYIEWATVATASKYKVQWALDKTYFDQPNLYKEQEVSVGNHCTITDITEGQTYYFRVQAINNSGAASKWSPVATVILGDAPNAPTTWSSTTTAIADENDVVYLYWQHNSTDDSDPTYAQIQLNITQNGVTTIASTSVNYETGNVRTVEGIDPLATSVDDADSDEKNGVMKWLSGVVNWVKGGFSIFSGDDEDDETHRDSYMISANSTGGGATIEWKVRTAGVEGDSDGKTYGDWSVSRTVEIYSQPTVELEVTDYTDSELTTMYQFPIKVKATASEDSNQKPIGYYLEIASGSAYETVDEIGNVKNINAGDLVYSKYFDISDSVLERELSANDMDLENNVEYTIKCTVAMSSGLTCEDSHTFEVSWTDEQYDPDATILIDNVALTASIQPYCKYEDDSYIENVKLSVYRREFDGSFTELETDIDNNGYTYVTDPHPALDYARYRIVAKSISTGAISKYDVPGYPIGEKGVVLQWDEDWSNFDVTVDEDGNTVEDERAESPWTGSMLKLPYNVDVSDNNTPDVELVSYIGRRYPVSYYGTKIDSSATWSVEIDKKDKETIYALRRLAIWAGDVYVREPSGSGYWANVAVSFNQTHCETTIPVTLNIKRVEGGV